MTTASPDMSLTGSCSPTGRQKRQAWSSYSDEETKGATCDAEQLGPPMLYEQMNTAVRAFLAITEERERPERGDLLAEYPHAEEEGSGGITTAALSPSEDKWCTLDTYELVESKARTGQFLRDRLVEVSYLVIFGPAFVAFALAFYIWVTRGIILIHPYLSLTGAIGSAGLWLTALLALVNGRRRRSHQ